MYHPTFWFYISIGIAIKNHFRCIVLHLNCACYGKDVNKNKDFVHRSHFLQPKLTFLLFQADMTQHRYRLVGVT